MQYTLPIILEKKIILYLTNNEIKHKNNSNLFEYALLSKNYFQFISQRFYKKLEFAVHSFNKPPKIIDPLEYKEHLLVNRQYNIYSNFVKLSISLNNFSLLISSDYTEIFNSFKANLQTLNLTIAFEEHHLDLVKIGQFFEDNQQLHSISLGIDSKFFFRKRDAIVHAIPKLNDYLHALEFDKVYKLSVKDFQSQYDSLFSNSYYQKFSNIRSLEIIDIHNSSRNNDLFRLLHLNSPQSVKTLESLRLYCKSPISYSIRDTINQFKNLKELSTNSKSLENSGSSLLYFEYLEYLEISIASGEYDEYSIKDSYQLNICPNSPSLKTLRIKSEDQLKHTKNLIEFIKNNSSLRNITFPMSDDLIEPLKNNLNIISVELLHFNKKTLDNILINLSESQSIRELKLEDIYIDPTQKLIGDFIVSHRLNSTMVLIK
ncbi:hypothetical protein DLAC_01934 [Tieghemostelium lacteum]|uniref:Uncharacterized protein n=1 Tax=Tieghemostelium lacteum TaxID=361077 RepID=A0A152A544_TIELA|nr:hypothetical protein DLAC_01934 [Tieghemostelium lacteum]|eukprot:KYR01344.1 hypothetical protein DLAC_01934 [Tieghemostelium lacteum]